MNKAAGLQIPGMGDLQKQQLQMLLQAKMLQTQGQSNVVTDPTVTDPVTAPPSDWSTIFGGNTANAAAAPGKASTMMTEKM